jgi:ferredoxin
MVWEIRQELEKCIGCGACVAVDPDNWDFDDKKNKAVLKKAKKDSDGTFFVLVDSLGKAKDAKDSCPVQCIHVKEK